MAASSLKTFEAQDAFESSPSFEKEMCDYLADRAEPLLEFFRRSPECADLPYGYETETKTGRRYRSEWRELNVLAAEMERIGFATYRKQIEFQFPTWTNVASELCQKHRVDRKDAEAWAWANSLSELALFVVHVLNIYHAERPLLANLYATNLREDALGRTNYQPTIEAFAKIVRRNLGWKGECYSKPQDRAILLVSLVERDLKGRVRSTGSNGIEYERACHASLVAVGFSVEFTPVTGDYGADLIAEKDGLRYAIQCKDLSKPVGIKGIQEAIGARRHYQADFACVCCDAGFTDAAIELATSNRVIVTALPSLGSQLELAR